MLTIISVIISLFTRKMMTEICVPYNTRSTTKVEEDHSGSLQCTKRSNYEIPSTKTVSYGLESIRYLGPKIWKLVPDELKELKSLELFKQKVKSLKFEDCPCKLCKNYIHGVGYID